MEIVVCRGVEVALTMGVEDMSLKERSKILATIFGNIFLKMGM